MRASKEEIDVPSMHELHEVLRIDSCIARYEDCKPHFLEASELSDFSAEHYQGFGKWTLMDYGSVNSRPFIRRLCVQEPIDDRKNDHHTNDCRGIVWEG